MYIKTESGYDLATDAAQKAFGTFTISHNVTGEMIEYIVVTAIEGGVNYWTCVDTDTDAWKERPNKMSISQFATQLLLQQKSVLFVDTEDNDGCWELTLDKLIKGIRLNMENRPHDCNMEDMDANTADSIIQYALFDEVVYG